MCTCIRCSVVVVVVFGGEVVCLLVFGGEVVCLLVFGGAVVCLLVFGAWLWVGFWIRVRVMHLGTCI